MYSIVLLSLIDMLSLQGGGSMHSIVLLSLYIVPTISLHGDSMHNIVLLSPCHLLMLGLYDGSILNDMHMPFHVGFY